MRSMQNIVAENRPDACHPASVHEFRFAVTQRHLSYLALWLAAGHRMGLHDVDVCSTDVHGRPMARHVVIWVRENADPAYAVIPAGMLWQVVDCIRRRPLGMFSSFEAALNFIRPVLEVGAAA